MNTSIELAEVVAARRATFDEAKQSLAEALNAQQEALQAEIEALGGDSVVSAKPSLAPSKNGHAAAPSANGKKPRKQRVNVVEELLLGVIKKHTLRGGIDLKGLVDPMKKLKEEGKWKTKSEGDKISGAINAPLQRLRKRDLIVGKLNEADRKVYYTVPA